MKRGTDKLKTEVARIEGGVKHAFSRLKGEMNEQRESINANFSEIEQLAGHLNALEERLEKIQERLDELTVIDRAQHPYAQLRVNLTVREQEVFLLYYTAQRSKSVSTIAQQLGLTTHMVQEVIFGLIAKGIPLIKKSAGYVLDKTFKDMQAQKELVSIDANVKQELHIGVSEIR